MRWREGSLLNLGKVVCWVLVQSDLANWSKWVLGVWPDLGQVKDGVLELLGLLLSHSLNTDGPRWELSTFDLLKEFLVVDVWVLTGKLDTFSLSVESNTLVRSNVDLSVDPVTVLLHQLESVARVSVLESVSSWDTSVTKEDHNLVNTLWVLTQVVPECIGILQVSLWVSLLSVDEVWELGWLSQEEDGRVVEDPVTVALSGSDLDRESSWVSGSVG